jgi:hypothetical protein
MPEIPRSDLIAALNTAGPAEAVDLLVAAFPLNDLRDIAQWLDEAIDEAEESDADGER